MKIWYLKGIWVRRKIRERIAPLAFEDIRSIAVLRHAALGDMVLTRAFLIEARKLFPNARITISVVTNQMRGERPRRPGLRGARQRLAPENIDHGKPGLLFALDKVLDLKSHLLELQSNAALRQQLADVDIVKTEHEFNDELHFAMLDRYLLQAVTSHGN